MSDCPYCSLARMKGELFCSRHSTDMQSLSSGVFYIKEKQFEECDWHVTRLSLNVNFDGSQSYFAGSREHKISPDKYLLLNEGQSFKTCVKSPVENRMVTIAFKVGLAKEIYQTLCVSEDKLIDGAGEPFVPVDFFEKTYSLDSFLHNKILSLIEPSATGYDEGYLGEQLEDILTHIVIVQKDLYREANSIKKVRASTRIEIYRRLHWALDFIHDNYCEDINIDQLAKQSCLSTFHFKRLFKDFFREAPYQYIKRLRVQKAGELLLTDRPVNEVCKAVGWEDPSSFIRLFKQVMHTTPNQYRKGHLRNRPVILF